MYMNRLTIQVSGETGRTDNYCAAIRGAGGEPVAGYCSAPDLRCHGLLLCGGGDIESAWYGQEDRGFSRRTGPGTGRSWSCSAPFTRRASPSWASAGGCS